MLERSGLYIALARATFGNPIIFHCMDNHNSKPAASLKRLGQTPDQRVLQGPTARTAAPLRANRV